MDKTIQPVFLNAICKEHILTTIYLLNGIKIKGRIKSFDMYCILLQSAEGMQIIYKHSISSIIPEKKLNIEFNKQYNEGEDE